MIYGPVPPLLQIPPIAELSTAGAVIVENYIRYHELAAHLVAAQSVLRLCEGAGGAGK